jgi:hypothetical protein
VKKEEVENGHKPHNGISYPLRNVKLKILLIERVGWSKHHLWLLPKIFFAKFCKKKGPASFLQKIYFTGKED